MFYLSICIATLLPLIGIYLSDAPSIWPLSVLLYSVGLILILGSSSKIKSATAAFGIIFFPLIILETSYFISQYLQGAGFNSTFWYHLRFDVIHAGVGEYLWLVALVLCIFSSLLFSFYRFSTKFNYARKKVVIGGIGLFFLGLVISPSATSLSVALLSPSPSDHDDLYSEFPELVNKSVSASFTGKERKNVVFIYLESIEQRYFDENVFPDLLPEMKALKDQSLVFTDVAQGIGAEYTMGGIVASECGYPLAAQHNITSGSFGIYDDFLPLATCLGDILDKDGYFESFLGGADARFAGKQKFLDAHGYSEVIDKTAILDQSEIAVPVNSWGVYDDTLFEHAFTKYLSLSSQLNPFLLTLLTLDTHHPSGHASPSCGIYGAGDNSILNAAHCTDSLVGRFIQKIRSSTYSDQTIIVVFSDHLAQRNTSSSLLRTSTMSPNLTFFVNFPNGQSGANTNAGTHYDIAPTILDLMGYDLQGQMGFGTSLIKGTGYLIEKFGKDGWQDKEIILNEIASSLWKNDVSLNNSDISFSAVDLSLSIDGNTFNIRSAGYSDIPAASVFVFDGKTLNLENIHSFPFSREIFNTSLGKILLQNKDDLIFAISNTMNLPGFCDQENHHPLEYCYFIGKPGSNDFLSAPIRGNFTVPKEIIHLLHNSKANPDLVEAREKLLEELESPRIYEGMSPPAYIAHAGGGINGETYTNSLEALNLNYDLGHRFFEIDFSWTRDSQLVAIHDWNESLERRFHQTDKPGTQTKDDFLELKPKNGLTQLTLPDVLEWANQKGDAYIITDIKNRNVTALRKIRREHGELSRHIIPQVYNYTEYYETRAMGYENVILTLYQMQINLKELVDFVAAAEPFAVTMQYGLAQDGLAQMLKPWKIFSYAHTVNDPELHAELLEKGIGGIYTDFLTPPR